MKIKILLMSLLFCGFSFLEAQDLDYDFSKDMLFEIANNFFISQVKKDSLNIENDIMEIICGHIFEKNKKHFVIRYNYKNRYKICGIYEVNSEELNRTPLLYNDSLCLVIVDDYIKDVNHDGNNDYIIHWYPLSGCCLRNIHNVYIYDSNIGKFMNPHKLVNPTYSSYEKAILCISYGQPGEVDLYKEIIEGMTFHKVEEISHSNNEESKFILKKYTYDKLDSTKHIDSLPNEYLKMENLDWFLNK